MQTFGSELYIGHPSLGVLQAEFEPLGHLTVKASRAYVWESQGSVENRDFTLNRCAQNLTCSRTPQKHEFERSLGQT